MLGLERKWLENCTAKRGREAAMLLSVGLRFVWKIASARTVAYKSATYPWREDRKTLVPSGCVSNHS